MCNLYWKQFLESVTNSLDIIACKTNTKFDIVDEVFGDSNQIEGVFFGVILFKTFSDICQLSYTVRKNISLVTLLNIALPFLGVLRQKRNTFPWDTVFSLSI